MFPSSISYREAVPITDKDGRVIAVLAGQPDDPGWDEVHQSAADSLDACRGKMKQGTHRRGRYPMLSSGISFGGGQTVRSSSVNAKVANSGLVSPKSA